MGSYLQVPFGLWNDIPPIKVSCSLALPEYGLLLLGSENGVITKWKLTMDYADTPVLLSFTLYPIVQCNDLPSWKSELYCCLSPFY